MKMDYEKLFDELVKKVGVEKLGKEEISRIIIEKYCPHFFGLPEDKYCGTDLQHCSKCWARALGLEEE